MFFNRSKRLLRFPDTYRSPEQTLILGPSGFRFGAYSRQGLMLELIVVMVSVPAILWVWPL